MSRQLDGSGANRHADWVAWCKERVAKYSVLDGKASTGELMNPYLFVRDLFEQLTPDDVVMCGNATACIVPFQMAKIKKGQRLISNSGAPRWDTICRRRSERRWRVEASA